MLHKHRRSKVRSAKHDKMQRVIGFLAIERSQNSQSWLGFNGIFSTIGYTVPLKKLLKRWTKKRTIQLQVPHTHTGLLLNQRKHSMLLI